MKRMTWAVWVVVCVWGGLAAAQEAASSNEPPKVLEIVREWVKPGKAGGTHEKSESAFVQAFTRAKWPTHYLAATSVTGRNRVLFFVGFDSFAAWEKDTNAQQDNAQLSAAVEKATMADGDILSDVDTSVAVYRPDQSLRPSGDLSHMRLMEIYLYRIKPGHTAEWDELVKMVKDAYEKVPDAHWDMYQTQYSAEGQAFLVFVPMKSAEEIDKGRDMDKAFAQALGEDGMKKLSDLESASVASSMTNLFQFSAAMSYPPPDWVKADSFWKAASAPAAKPKAAEKPAAKP